MSPNSNITTTGVILPVPSLLVITSCKFVQASLLVLRWSADRRGPAPLRFDGTNPEEGPSCALDARETAV